MVKRKKTTAKRKTKRKSSGKRKSGLAQTMYSLSPELAEIVGAKKMTRPQVVKKVWVYIKAHKLQDSKHRRIINPDKKLSAVLGSRPIDMLKMAGAMNKHIEK